MINQRISNIKRAQKESLLLREISQLYLQLTMDHPELQNLFINRVQLSSDKSTCNVFFYSAQGLEGFERLRPKLVLYKPSMRKALAQSISSRYTPNIVFKYDHQFEKQQQIETALNKIQQQED